MKKILIFAIICLLTVNSSIVFAGDCGQKTHGEKTTEDTGEKGDTEQGGEIQQEQDNE